MSPTGFFPICALCLKEKELLDSHIIPAFVYKWIKETSATGFLRMGESPNLRQQDGPKRRLLCKKCESVLNDYETLFAKNIFHPYVETELSNDGIATGKIKYFNHDDWLLRFIISLHWRLLVAKDYTADSPVKLTKILGDIKENWRKFLLKEEKYTGECESHIIFFQNMASARGFIPPDMNDRINYYLLRGVDGGKAFSKNKVRVTVFSKIGPIGFLTAIRPNKLKNTNDSRVRMRGKIKTAQCLSNPLLTRFFFIDRPNQVIPHMGFSERQWGKIEKAYKINPNRAEKSMTLKAVEADKILKMKKEVQEEWNNF